MEPEATEPVVDGPEVPELPEGDYYSLTLGPHELLRGEDLAEDLRDARAALKVLTDERDALDRDLAEIEAKAADRRRQRAELEAQQDAQGDAGDVDGAIASEAMLGGLAKVDARQGLLAEARRARRAELVETEIPPAEDAVRAAEAAVSEHSAEHAGKVPHTLVDWAYRQAVDAYLRESKGGLDGNDAPGLAEVLTNLVDSVARTVASDPEKAARVYEASIRPRPERKLSVEEAAEQYRRAEARLREAFAEEDADAANRRAAGERAALIAAGGWAR